MVFCGFLGQKTYKNLFDKILIWLTNLISMMIKNELPMNYLHNSSNFKVNKNHHCIKRGHQLCNQITLQENTWKRSYLDWSSSQRGQGSKRVGQRSPSNIATLCDICDKCTKKETHVDARTIVTCVVTLCDTCNKRDHCRRKGEYKVSSMYGVEQMTS